MPENGSKFGVHFVCEYEFRCEKIKKDTAFWGVVCQCVVRGYLRSLPQDHHANFATQPAWWLQRGNNKENAASAPKRCFGSTSQIDMSTQSLERLVLGGVCCQAEWFVWAVILVADMITHSTEDPPLLNDIFYAKTRQVVCVVCLGVFRWRHVRYLYSRQPFALQTLDQRRSNVGCNLFRSNPAPLGKQARPEPVVWTKANKYV